MQPPMLEQRTVKYENTTIKKPQTEPTRQMLTNTNANRSEEFHRAAYYIHGHDGASYE